MKKYFLFAALLWLPLSGAIGQKTETKPATQATSVSSEAEVTAMKADLQRMRSLVAQMQNNLAFVGSTTTPLRHQFELEIEMWQVAIGELERRIGAAERTKHP